MPPTLKPAIPCGDVSESGKRLSGVVTGSDGAGLVFWGFDPAGGVELLWSRGFNYEAIGEGHYEDD